MIMEDKEDEIIEFVDSIIDLYKLYATSHIEENAPIENERKELNSLTNECSTLKEKFKILLKEFKHEC